MSNGGSCSICGADKTWRPPGNKRDTGKAYPGFWGCPNYKNHPPPQTQGAPHVTPQGTQAAPARPPAARQTAYTPPTPFDARERSIAAQACCKSACEATAGWFAAGLVTPSARTSNTAIEVTVKLANKLFREVVWVAIHTQDPGVLRPAPPQAPPPLQPQEPPQYEQVPPFPDDPDINF